MFIILAAAYLVQSNFEFGVFLQTVINVAMFGAFGAFFSVAVRIRGVEIDVYDSKIVIFLSSLLRILVGMSGAIILFVLICGDLVFSSYFDFDLQKNTSIPDNVRFALYSFSILAGFSENFVPDMLGKISNENGERNK